MNYPGDLNAAVTAWLAAHNRGGLADKTAQLSTAYRKGETSSAVDLSAYLVSRAPATFAANLKVQAALAVVWPDFAPQSLLDIGTGPGTATWAALQQWPDIAKVTQCEQDKSYAALAFDLNAASNLPTLMNAGLVLKSEATLSSDVKADLVIASYVLAELPLHTMAQVARRLWARIEQVLILIEPGTPQGFARLRVARDTLIGQGGFALAPCTHHNSCPMLGEDWCHFKIRVQRSREHMHAKQATVPFEDEAFSYLIMTRQPQPLSGGRVLTPIAVSKVAAMLHLCDADGLRDEVIASRDKATYKRAKKAQWGDVWE